MDQGEDQGQGISVRSATGPPVGSEAWLEIERQKLRKTDAGSKAKQGPILIVFAAVLLVGGAWFDWYLLSHRNRSGYVLTPYGVALLCIFPLALGVAVLVAGVRQMRAGPNP